MKQTGKDGEVANKGFEDLMAWQLARRLMIECHRLAETLPAIERFDLAPQIRRSSKSVTGEHLAKDTAAITTWTVSVSTISLVGR